jgi:hypothetical protein
VFSRIFLIASKIGESLGSYQEYPAKLVGKQREEFLIAAQVKSWQDSLSRVVFTKSKHSVKERFDKRPKN